MDTSGGGAVGCWCWGGEVWSGVKMVGMCEKGGELGLRVRFVEKQIQFVGLVLVSFSCPSGSILSESRDGL